MPSIRRRPSIALRRRTPGAGRRLAGAGVVVVVLAGVATTATAGAAKDPGRDLLEVGVMPHAVEADSQPSPLIVDEQRSLGFAIGDEVDPGPNGTRDRRLVVHDLARPEAGILGRYPAEETPATPLGFSGRDVFRFAIDEEAGRLIAPGAIGLDPTPCNPVIGTVVEVFDYGPSGGTSIDRRFVFMPCSGTQKFQAISGSVYTVGSGAQKVRKLLLAGSYATEGWRGGGLSLVGFENNAGQPLVVRQLDLDTFYASEAGPDPDALDWEIDLRYSGCGRWDQNVVLLERLGPDLISYCWETRPVLRSLGSQGYVVRIPLGDDHTPDTIQGAAAAPDPANPGGAAPTAPTAPAPAPSHSFDPGRLLAACQAGGFTGDLEGCITAAAAEAERQANETVADNTGDVPTPDPDAAPASTFIANPVVRRIPALPGTVYPFADPVSGRVLLLSADSVNGNAVYAFDPRRERFIGLVTGGAVDQPIDKTAGALDAVRGRAYLLTSGGILSASVRQTPLPGGKVHDVVTGDDQVTQWRLMAVAPRLHRIFITLQKRGGAQGYAMVEDRTIDPKVPGQDDPDSRTRQVDEEPGKTEVDRSGAAQSSGAHVVVVGGLPRVANQVDPACESPSGVIPEDVSFERGQFNGSCLADLVVTRGNREYSLAYANVDAGTATGASAEASGLFVPLTERPTDADVKNAGSCAAGTFQGLGASADDLAGYRQFCDQVQDRMVSPAIGDDLRRGTQGGGESRAGKGFPVPSALCNDFGGDPSADSEPRDHKRQVVRATAACDGGAAAVTGQAEAMGLPLPAPALGTIGVERLWSDVRTFLSPGGQVTVGTAVAEGVTVGPLRLGQITTTSISRAKGRTGTAEVGFWRRWCGVQLDGVTVSEGCVDPGSPEVASLIDTVNGLPGRARLSVPDVSSVGTPGGYQAVVTKHPDERAADQAVNDDDSQTVSGLQIVVYNDGTEGRSRVIVQLAGVQTEARYAVVVLPDFALPDLSGFEAGDDPVVDALEIAASEPPRFETIPAIPASSARPTDNPLRRLLQNPFGALSDLLGWLMNHLGEAALLFLLLSILATPVYLFLRRRAFEAAMAP